MSLIKSTGHKEGKPRDCTVPHDCPGSGLVFTWEYHFPCSKKIRLPGIWLPCSNQFDEALHCCGTNRCPRNNHPLAEHSSNVGIAKKTSRTPRFLGARHADAATMVPAVEADRRGSSGYTGQLRLATAVQDGGCYHGWLLRRPSNFTVLVLSAPSGHCRFLVIGRDAAAVIVAAPSSSLPQGTLADRRPNTRARRCSRSGRGSIGDSLRLRQEHNRKPTGVDARPLAFPFQAFPADIRWSISLSRLCGVSRC